MSVILLLFLSMLKIGCFAFGGGYAIIALLENEFISKRKWIDHDEFLDVVAIAESTPGPIAINVATYIGYKLKGVFGAVIATLGMCLPSFIIMYLVSLFYEQFMEITLVAAAFKGIQICIVYLIASAGLKMLKKMKKTPINELGLYPHLLTCGSGKKVWWKCRICHNDWQSDIKHRNIGRGCPRCSILKRGYSHTSLFSLDGFKSIEELHRKRFFIRST